MRVSLGYLLDTNVLSELMRQEPSAAVMRWFDGRAEATLFTSTISKAEVLTGIALLPRGKRRDALAVAAERMFDRDFADRCLPFCTKAAEHYALVRAECSRLGRPMSTEDGQIAAIALEHRLSLVTRNVKDFESVTGLVCVNPWR